MGTLISVSRHAFQNPAAVLATITETADAEERDACFEVLECGLTRQAVWALMNRDITTDDYDMLLVSTFFSLSVFSCEEKILVVQILHIPKANSRSDL